ncbi:hypothetical protein BOX15_Mlig013540g1 [Macrostomum lignano]|uniref:Fasciculation and elongation protein zeta-2 n=2 Tax=Macrostomum lignano TaxID=282301 RepID=A0A267FP62_9PLAT|nr:hypothetical protein BOX15_Mlig013540g1 [Macrostomum lignano]
MAASLDFHSMVTSMLPDDAGDALDSDRVSTEALVQQLKSLLECGDGGSGSDSDAAAEEVDEVDGAAAADYQLPGGVGGVLLSPSQQELLQFRAENGEDLSQLSAGALNEYLNELECLISELNDTLVTELARRDELALDREVKEQFINLLTAVQAKKRESRQQLHQQHQQPQHMAFTTLPLRKRGLSDTEHLQTLNGILRAMLLNAPEVSSLLTDYILRVYAPILPEA